MIFIRDNLSNKILEKAVFQSDVELIFVEL